MRAYEFVTEAEKMSRRKFLGNLAAGAALGAAGYAGLSNMLDKSTQSGDQTVPSTPEIASKEATVKLPNPLENDLKNFAISNGIVGKELAQFMAQCAHETGNFSSLTERGSNAYFKKLYGGLRGIAHGNTHPGDWKKFIGRGFIHLTWRPNYEDDKLNAYLGTTKKEGNLAYGNNYLKASEPKLAKKIAVWYWLNKIRGHVDDVTNTRQVTNKINKNEAMKHTQDRLAKYIHYLEVFGLGDYEKDELKI